ncbi:MAG: DUF167 domain-containing protein [Candidatus Bathyarchaeota archaeon]|nr:DUF167 domain-containing protein [Candidatus Bathyarchaeota archaeon]MDH5689715.1 DUF167 domain-containing protein [Candidatus Bathyarchaeota archaeon]
MRYEVEVEFRRDFVKVDGSRIFVGLRSRPIEGKANLELIKKLARYFRVSSSQVRIISGLKSRRKTVEITI